MISTPATNTGVPNVARNNFYKLNKATMYLKVAGIKYSISQWSATFAVNEIPQATCMMATGKAIQENTQGLVSGESLASTEAGVGYTEAKVYLNMDGNDWDPITGKKWPSGGAKGSGDRVVFEGYLVGISYHRIEGKIQLMASLVHKLIDLTFGSIFSKAMHPSNPLSMISPAVSQVANKCNSGTTGATGKGGWTIAGLLGDKLRESPNCKSITQGGFGCKLIGALECLATLDLFKIKCGVAAGATGSGPNKAAADVLARLASETGPEQSPLDAPPFDTAIVSFISNSLTAFAGTTFWDLLVSKWCPDFVLSFCPLPSATGGPYKGAAYGAIIPNYPTYKIPFKTLYLNDYVDFMIKTQQHKPLFAVGIVSPGVTLTGAVPGDVKDGGDGDICMSGVYPDVGFDAKVTGQFLALNAPGWMQSVIPYAPGASSMGAGANTAVDPNPGQGGRTITFEKSKGAMRTMLDRIAHAYYAANYFRGRFGSFSSKLRFDISPGSIICLKAEKNPFAGLSFFGVEFGGSDAPVKSLPEDVYAHVSRVTYNINSDSPMAKTKYDLTAVRNTKENESNAALDAHPFFGASWSGMELIQDWGL
jgi:hypothetical protein